MKIRATQQTIVFGIFVLMAAGFALFLPGFARVDNSMVMAPGLSTVDFSRCRLALGAGASIQAAVAAKWVEGNAR